MHILQVPRRFVRSEWGGTETVILETSKQLLRAGHRTEIFCTNALGGQDTEVMDGVQVRRVPYFYPYWGLSDEARYGLDKKGGSPFSFALMKALKKYPGLDLIHLHAGNRIGGIGRHVAIKRRIPYVVSVHGGVFDVPAAEAETLQKRSRGAIEWGKALGWWVGSRRVFDDAAAIICVGQQEQVLFKERFPHKSVHYLPNGVNAERFSGGDGNAFRKRYNIPQDARAVLTVGRIDKQKNQIFAVRALPRLLKDIPNLHFIFIGHVTNQKYYEQLTRTISELGVGNHVTVIPGVDFASPDLVDSYCAADVFLLPSIHEPFGIVILEAWAAGLPVVASRVGGVVSFVSDGKDGRLFDVDDRESFFQAFKEVITNPNAMKALARAGKEKVRTEFGWDKITEKLVGIYEEALLENSVRE